MKLTQHNDLIVRVLENSKIEKFIQGLILMVSRSKARFFPLKIIVYNVSYN